VEDRFVTRKTLLHRASDQADEEAWGEFVLYYKTFIFMLLRNLNVSLEDCEDLTQNILVRIWKKLESYDSERAKFRTWLSVIIRNEVFTHYDRKKRRHDKHDRFRESLPDNFPPSGEFDQIFEREWAIYIVNKAMQCVKKSFHGNAVEVFELTLDGMSVQEICRKLEIKEFTVYALRSRVKKRLTDEIARLRSELEL